MAASHSHDVLIVGAGPSGSTLGYLLAEKGLDVCIIDKARFPRPKLCGGALTCKTRKLLEEIYKVPFEKQFSTEAKSDEYAVYEKNKQKIFQGSPELFYFINREKYDATLVSIAREKGCKFQFEQQVTEIDFQSGVVYTRPSEILKEADTSEEADDTVVENEHKAIAKNAYKDRNKVLERNRFAGKLVVGADGVNSVVRTRLFPGLDFHRNSGLGFQISIPSEKIHMELRTPVPRVFLGMVRCGYGWIFPHGKQFVVGLWGLIRKNKNVKAKFLNYLDKVAEIEGGKLSHIPSHLGPAGNFMETPGEKNVLLVGDAAGFADPLTGEGIFYAHKSAACAAAAVCDFFESGKRTNLIKTYRSTLDPVIKELKIALRVRNILYSDLRYFAYFYLRDPRILAKLAGIIHGTKSYSKLPFLLKL